MEHEGSKAAAAPAVPEGSKEAEPRALPEQPTAPAAQVPRGMVLEEGQPQQEQAPATLHPDQSTNARIYVHYTRSSDGENADKLTLSGTTSILLAGTITAFGQDANANSTL